MAPLHCRDGAIRFLKLTSVTAIRVAPPVGPHETSGGSLREGWLPKEKWQITKIFGEVFPSRGPLTIWRGIHVDISRWPGEAVSTNEDQKRWKPERAPVSVAICLLHFFS